MKKSPYIKMDDIKSNSNEILIITDDDDDNINNNNDTNNNNNTKKKRSKKKNISGDVKEYSKDVLNGDKCNGINACCYLFGTLIVAIPLGIGIAITFKINSDNDIIPFFTIIFSLLFLIISTCLCCVFKLIVQKDKDDNFGSTVNNNNDTFLSCCIKLNNDEHTRDLNMFAYVICFLIIGTPIGIAIKMLLDWKIRNYIQVGVLLIVFSIVGLVFLLLIILMLKLKAKHKNDDDDYF